jgi:hypothetical protein
MILSGSNAAATEAAGKFAAIRSWSPGLCRHIAWTRMMNSFNLKMPLRVTTTAASLNTFDVIACHRLSHASLRAD